MLMATAVGAPAARTTPASPQSCQALAVSRLRCPDLVILRPYDVYVERAAPVVGFDGRKARLHESRHDGFHVAALEQERAHGMGIERVPAAGEARELERDERRERVPRQVTRSP